MSNHKYIRKQEKNEYIKKIIYKTDHFIIISVYFIKNTQNAIIPTTLNKVKSLSMFNLNTTLP